MPETRRAIVRTAYMRVNDTEAPPRHIEPKQGTSYMRARKTRAESQAGNVTHPWCLGLRGVLLHLDAGDLEGADDLVLLHVLDLGQLPELVDGRVAELAGVALHVRVVDVGDAPEEVPERVARVHVLQEVHVVLHERGCEPVLQHDDVRVVDGPVRVLLGDEGCEREACTLARGLMVGRERRGRCQRDSEQCYVEKAGHRRRRRRRRGRGGGDVAALLRG